MIAIFKSDFKSSTTERLEKMRPKPVMGLSLSSLKESGSVVNMKPT